MEIHNYDEQPPGKSTIALFDVYIPSFRLSLKRLKLIKTKKGNLIIAFPSYAKEKEDGTKSWHSYIEFSEEKGREFQSKVLELIQTHFKVA